MINIPTTLATAESPYQHLRGPLDHNSEEYSKWATIQFIPFIKQYQFLHKAFEEGNIILNHVDIDEPYGHQVTFKVIIKNSVIREWWHLNMLSKPYIQRGSKTEDGVKLSEEDRRYWQACFFDKLHNHSSDSYLFAFSKFWKNGWLSNGGHRIILDYRVYYPTGDMLIQNIDFDYIFDYFDLEDDNTIKSTNLNGCEDINSVITKMGITNWLDKRDNTWHSVDLMYFKHPDKKTVLFEHSKRFIEYNNNISTIDKTHAVECETNDLVRISTNWDGFNTGQIDPMLLQTFPQKKKYTYAKVYQWSLQTLQYFSDGLDSKIGEGDILTFVKDRTKVDKDTYDKYVTFRSEILRLYHLIIPHSENFNLAFDKIRQFFCLMMTLKDAGNCEQIGNILDENKFVRDVADVYGELLNEGDKEPDSFYGVRSSSTNPVCLKQMIAMLLSRLLDKGSIVLLDKERNISKYEKGKKPMVSKITGQRLTKKTRDFDHYYLDFAKGGISTPENVFPIEKKLNKLKNDMSLSTSQLVKHMLSHPELSKEFTDKYKSDWVNGGMKEQVKLENDDRFKFKIVNGVTEVRHNTYTFESFKLRKNWTI